MSLIDNPKILQRWCAAVVSDYEMVTSQFMVADDWKFTTFRQKMETCGTLLLHHCAVGKGKRMAEQHELITKIIIETAKDLWLEAPMSSLLKLDPSELDTLVPSEPLSRVKQMIAGFYLTYSMFKTRLVCRSDQTIRIDLNAQDLLCLQHFKNCVAEKDGIPVFTKRCIKFMLIELELDNAYEFVSESTMRGIDPITRLYNNVMKSATSEINRDLKDRQYTNILPLGLKQLSEHITEFEVKKSLILKDSLAASAALPIIGKWAQSKESPKPKPKPNFGNPVPIKSALKSGQLSKKSIKAVRIKEPTEAIKTESIKTELTVKSTPTITTKSDSVDDYCGTSNALVPYKPPVIPEPQSFVVTTLDRMTQEPPLLKIIQAATICHVLNDTPVQTVANMLANNIADRAMMCESRKKLERKAHHKSAARASEQFDSAAGPKKSGPYIQDGGIFGRKRVTRRGDEQRDRPKTDRQPAESSSNLWSYVNSGRFVKST